jgi:hypothetical protein
MAAAMPTITLDWLFERTRWDGTCLVWTGYVYVSPHGYDVPKARATKDSQPMQVRRLVWRAMTGREPGYSQQIVRACDTWACVGPDCLCMRRNGDALRGRALPLQHRAKIAAAQRARGLSDLDEETVLAIRLSPLPIEKEAALRGVGETTVAEIRRGTRWRNYEDNPWLQLAR